MSAGLCCALKMSQDRDVPCALFHALVPVFPELCFQSESMKPCESAGRQQCCSVLEAIDVGLPMILD